jgi:hypothetical protein
MLLAGNGPQSGAKLGAIVSPVLCYFSSKCFNNFEDLSTEAQGLARVTVKTTGLEVRTPWWGVIWGMAH